MKYETRFPHFRLALGRMFVLIAYSVLPGGADLQRRKLWRANRSIKCCIDGLREDR